MKALDTLKHFVYAVPMSTPDNEDNLFREEVEEVKRWWNDSRWTYTRRPYTADQIVAKRGNIKVDFPSNVLSKKLWQIFESRFEV